MKIGDGELTMGARMCGERQWRFRRVFIHGIALLLLLLSAQQASALDQVPQAWTSDAVAGVYPTKEAALTAVQARGGRYAYAKVLERIAQSGSLVKFTYGAGNWSPLVGQWSYTAQWATGGPFASEEQGVAAVLAQRYESAPNCPASVTPESDWTVAQAYYGSGISTIETRFYGLRFGTPIQCTPQNYTRIQFTRQRTVGCPADLYYGHGEKACIYPAIASVWSQPTPCNACDLRSNPVNISVAEKYQEEVDYDLPFLRFSRHYHSSRDALGSGFGGNWTHSLNVRFVPGSSGAGLLQAEDGALVPFQSFEAIDGSEWRYSSTSRGYEVRRRDITYVFKSEPLSRIERSDGRYINLSYDTLGRLNRAVDQSGRALTFNFGSAGGPAPAKITSISLGDQVLVAYQYDSSGRLVGSQYPDGSLRTYHYENANLPDLLTGVTDENGVRFSTFEYDGLGRPIKSEHAGGAGRGTFTYRADGSALYLDANGNLETNAFDAQGTFRKLNQVTDGAGTITTTYAPPGQDFRTRVTQQRDKAGVVTSYAYSDYSDAALGDVRKTTVKSALGTPVQRVREEIRSRASSNLLRVVTPALQTDFIRNARGQVVTITEKSVADSTTHVVSRRYCEQEDVDVGVCPRIGLLVSEDGGRVDVADVTSYHYYMDDDVGCAAPGGECRWRKGDLWKTTNAKGQVTEALRYDGAGRLLSLKDPNGVVTDLVYDARGRLGSRATRASN